MVPLRVSYRCLPFSYSFMTFFKWTFYSAVLKPRESSERDVWGGLFSANTFKLSRRRREKRVRAALMCLTKPLAFVVSTVTSPLAPQPPVSGSTSTSGRYYVLFCFLVPIRPPPPPRYSFSTLWPTLSATNIFSLWSLLRALYSSYFFLSLLVTKSSIASVRIMHFFFFVCVSSVHPTLSFPFVLKIPKSPSVSV